MVQAPTKPPRAPLSAPKLSPDLVGSPPITLRLPKEWALSDECMVELGERNDALGFERTAEGALLISFPSGFHVGKHEASVGAQVVNWRFEHGLGETTGATGGYRLTDGSLLVPDAAWISDERLEGIEIGPTRPMPAAPDFVLEIRSGSQDISEQQEKMEQWMANGVRLGWLLDPFDKFVLVYREGQDEPELLGQPDSISGEAVMPGLVVDLTRVWAG